MSDTPTPETDAEYKEAQDYDPSTFVEPLAKFLAVERERDEARRERDEAMDALKWIAKRYCHEKSTFQLAQEAYEMSSTARWALQKIEQKEEAK